MSYEKQNSIKEICLLNTETFAQIAAKMLKAILDVKYSPEAPEFIQTGLSIENKFIVIIGFMGTVYGEFILAMDDEVAARCVGASLKDHPNDSAGLIKQNISDTFCEILNIVVGESIVMLSKQFDKLTFTAPKVFWGVARYPQFKTGRVRLSGGHGPIDCYLFIDCMQLDIVTSYLDALKALTLANDELRQTLIQVQHQQSLLVQTEKMAALGTMAAGIAHEINTPLASVTLVGAEMKALLTEAIFDPDSLVDHISVIEKTIARISKITNSLRIFALGSNQSELKEIFINELIEEIILLYKPQLAESGIAINFENKLPHLKIECWHSEISQVLLNLLKNASDAVVKLPEKWISIAVLDSHKDITISVSDSGSGISNETKSKVFDPFFTTKGVGKGTGLGLSISRGIIENHGGSISLDSQSIHTCFIIRLPKKQKTSMSS